MSKSVKYRGKPGTPILISYTARNSSQDATNNRLFKMSLLQETKDQVKNISSSGISYPQTYLVSQLCYEAELVALPTHFTTGELPCQHILPQVNYMYVDLK